MSTNPWLGTVTRVTPPELADEPPASPLVELAPQPGIKPPHESDRIPRHPVGAGAGAAGVWWVGVHGGAGESTLEQLVEGSRAAGHAWPLAPSTHRCRVVLVARTHAHGLRAAQLAATEWASGSVAVHVAGLVLIADAPGRLPRVLKDFSDLVAGGVPRVWRLPWVEAWRQGEPVSANTAPKAIHHFLDDVRASTLPSHPANNR
jgi:uncharacterized protein DUF6668